MLSFCEPKTQNLAVAFTGNSTIQSNAIFCVLIGKFHELCDMY